MIAIAIYIRGIYDFMIENGKYHNENDIFNNNIVIINNNIGIINDDKGIINDDKGIINNNKGIINNNIGNIIILIGIIIMKMIEIPGNEGMVAQIIGCYRSEAGTIPSGVFYF